MAYGNTCTTVLFTFNYNSRTRHVVLPPSPLPDVSRVSVEDTWSLSFQLSVRRAERSEFLCTDPSRSETAPCTRTV